MDGEAIAIAASLFGLAALLVGLTIRGVVRYRRSRGRVEAMWTGGLGFAAAAMIVEAVVYTGYSSPALLELYVFLSAAIVGVLSLGATHVIPNPRVVRGYTVYVAALTGILAIASALVAPPAGMVSGGIITGNPAVSLLILSSLITFPATIVLLASAVVSLRRSMKWQTMLLVGGALILGAGGTLYIASFPVALYYAEFVGILLLFFGIVSLPHPSPSPTPSLAAAASQ